MPETITAPVNRIFPTWAEKTNPWAEAAFSPASMKLWETASNGQANHKSPPESTAHGGNLLVAQLEQYVPLALGFVEEVRSVRKTLFDAGWAGRAEQAHLERPLFLQFIENRLHMIQRLHEMVRRANQATGSPIPGSEKLTSAEKEISDLKDDLFSKWQTLEDLEDLLAQTFPLSRERLEALADKYPPPASWWAEEDNPF